MRLGSPAAARGEVDAKAQLRACRRVARRQRFDSAACVCRAWGACPGALEDPAGLPRQVGRGHGVADRMAMAWRKWKRRVVAGHSEGGGLSPMLHAWSTPLLSMALFLINPLSSRAWPA